MAGIVMRYVITLFLLLSLRANADSEIRLRVGRLELSTDNRLVVLGIDRSEIADDGFDLSQLGFNGEGMQNLDPKFLLTVNADGVNAIHSFEIGGDFHFSSKGLPPRLLTIPHAKGALLRDNLISFAEQLTGPFDSLLGLLGREHDYPRRTQASYLQKIVDLALDEGRFKALDNQFSRDQLTELGAALTARYHPYNPAAGLFTNSKNRVEFYEALRDARGEIQSRQMSVLIRAANERGLIAIPITNAFAILFIDPLDTEARGQLVPLGIFSVDVKHLPLPIVDFHDPLKNSARERLLSLIQSVADAGFGFAPLWEIRIGTFHIDGLLRVLIKRSGSTLLDTRIRSNGELSAILETGIAEYNVESIQIEALLQEAQAWGLSDEELALVRTRLESRDPSTRKAVIDELMAQMTQDESRNATFFGYKDAERLRLHKSRVLDRLRAFLESDRSRSKLDRDLTKKLASRDPASESPPRPVIYFMVDGMRPDRFREAAANGIVPTMKKLFIDRGVELAAYNSWSISIPNWSTLLTGFEMDEHEVRSNTPASRADGGKVVDVINFPEHMTVPKYIKEGRSARMIEEAGLKWLARYYARDQVLMNFLPVNEWNYPPALGILKYGLDRIDQMAYGIFAGVEALDAVSADKTADEIRKKPGRHRLVMNWYGTIDTHSHHNTRMLERGMKLIDDNIRRILEAASHDPILKDATVVMVSDHGHLGGIDAATSESPLCPQRGLVNNTSLNMIDFLMGGFLSLPDYNFTVRTAEPRQAAVGLGDIAEYVMRPYENDHWHKSSSLDAKGTTKTQPTALVDYAGDNMSQIYLRGEKDWGKRHNFAELSQFRELTGETHDIPSDLLNLRLRNLETVDPAMRACISERTQNYPVQFLVMPLSGELARRSVDALVSKFPAGETQREPVLVHARGNRSAIIQIRRRADGEDEFRYLVVKNFNQDLAGTVYGAISNDPASDPLNYLGSLGSADELALWRTDREWLAYARHTDKPTAIFALGRGLTLSPRLAGNPVFENRIPDFVLISNFGFNFNGGVPLESDHGGLSPQEVRHSLFVSGIGAQAMSAGSRLEDLVLSRDVVPTILDYAGLKDEALQVQGKSFRQIVDAHAQH